MKTKSPTLERRATLGGVKNSFSLNQLTHAIRAASTKNFYNVPRQDNPQDLRVLGILSSGEHYATIRNRP